MFNGKIRALFSSTTVLLMLVGGCASPEEYDAEPDRTINEEAAVGIGGAVPAEPVPNPLGPADRRDLLNMQKLANVPEPVRNAFQRSYPGAGITSIQILDAATGLRLYEINFLIGGTAYDVVYRPDGTPIRRDPLEHPV